MNTVDRLITIDKDIQLVLEGKKTTTRRNGRHAEPGDVFELAGKKFEVTNVYEQSLGEMTDSDAQKEGFENMEGYKSYILSMHKGMPWVPQMKVWVHEFKSVD